MPYGTWEPRCTLTLYISSSKLEYNRPHSRSQQTQIGQLPGGVKSLGEYRLDSNVGEREGPLPRTHDCMRQESRYYTPNFGAEVPIDRLTSDDTYEVN